MVINCVFLLENLIESGKLRIENGELRIENEL